MAVGRMVYVPHVREEEEGYVREREGEIINLKRKLMQKEII